MFEKCIKCEKIGESCVPNLMLLPFPALIQWCDKRQRHHGWTDQDLADNSKVPLGTIKRIKAGDYLDCKYSTIKNILITLIGGTKDEFSCTAQVEKELRQLQQLEQQTSRLELIEEENKRLKEYLEAYHGEVEFLKEEIKAWRSLHRSKD